MPAERGDTCPVSPIGPGCYRKRQGDGGRGGLQQWPSPRSNPQGRWKFPYVSFFSSCAFIFYHILGLSAATFNFHRLAGLTQDQRQTGKEVPSSNAGWLLLNKDKAGRAANLNRFYKHYRKSHRLLQETWPAAERVALGFTAVSLQQHPPRLGHSKGGLLEWSPVHSTGQVKQILRLSLRLMMINNNRAPRARKWFSGWRDLLRRGLLP